MVSCDFVLWLDDIAFAGFVRKHLSAGALVYQQCKQTFWRRLQVISTLLTFADSDMWAEKIANVFF